MKKIIALWLVMGAAVMPLISMNQAAIVSPADCRLALQNIAGQARGRVPNTRHNSQNKMILQTFIHALSSLELLETNTEKREIISGVLNSANADFATGGFDGPRMAMLAQQVLEVVESDDIGFGGGTVSSMSGVVPEGDFDLYSGVITRAPEIQSSDEQALIQLRRQFAALLTHIAPIELALRSRGDSNISHEQVEIIKTIGKTAVELVDNIIAIDSSLTGEQKCQLMRLGEKIQDHLDLVARQGRGRAITPQSAAKVAVFVIQGLLEIAAVLAIQVQKLSLSDRPELVQKRHRYGYCGIAAVSIAVVLSAIIIGTNAAGITDIQIVPAMMDLIKPLTGLL